MYVSSATHPTIPMHQPFSMSSCCPLSFVAPHLSHLQFPSECLKSYITKIVTLYHIHPTLPCHLPQPHPCQITSDISSIGCEGKWMIRNPFWSHMGSLEELWIWSDNSHSSGDIPTHLSNQSALSHPDITYPLYPLYEQYVYNVDEFA